MQTHTKKKAKLLSLHFCERRRIFLLSRNFSLFMFNFKTLPYNNTNHLFISSAFCPLSVGRAAEFIGPFHEFVSLFSTSFDIFALPRSLPVFNISLSLTLERKKKRSLNLLSMCVCHPLTILFLPFNFYFLLSDIDRTSANTYTTHKHVKRKHLELKLLASALAFSWNPF